MSSDFFRLLRTQPAVWVFGLLSAAALTLFEAAGPLLIPITIPTDPTSVPQFERMMGDIEALANTPERLWGWAGTVAAALLVVWLITALNQAGLIHAAAAGIAQQRVTIVQGWGFAIRHLLPLLIVDTLIFFPLFLMSVVLIASALGSLLSVALAPGPVDLANLGPLTWLGLLCLLPALLLTPLVGGWTALRRPLAIRNALLHGYSGRAAVRAVWSQIKHETGPFLLAVFASLLLFATAALLQSAADALLRLLPLPATLLPWLALLLHLPLLTVRITLLSVLWTLTAIQLK